MSSSSSEPNPNPIINLQLPNSDTNFDSTSSTTATPESNTNSPQPRKRERNLGVRGWAALSKTFLQEDEAKQQGGEEQSKGKGLIWGKKEDSPINLNNNEEGNRIRKLGVGKDKGGWNELPINILHLIFSYAIDLPAENNCLTSTWRNKPPSFEVVIAVQQRIALCRLRYISSNWRTAIDSHPFWPSYTLLLDLSKPHSSTIEDIDSARLTPSTPSFPTLFHRARHTTLSICIPCRLNHPHRLGFYPAVLRRQVYTGRFGFTPTCQKHHNHFCSGCFKEYGIETLSPIQNGSARWRRSSSDTPEIPESTGLLMINLKDTDEHGELRYKHDLICKACRQTSIFREITRILKQCARGGKVTGLAKNNWVKNPFIEEYILDSTSICNEMARKAVEWKWLQDHTRYYELHGCALKLQRNERILRQNFFKRQLGNASPPSSRYPIMNMIGENAEEKLIRLRGEYELNGEDYNGKESQIDRFEVQLLHQKWSKQLMKMVTRFNRDSNNGRQQSYNDDSDDDEDDDDDSDDENGSSEGALNEKWQEKLRTGCINDWLNDRIRFGFWVTPSDEVARLQIEDFIEPSNPSVGHTPFESLCVYAKHPFHDYIVQEEAYTPENAIMDYDGIMKLFILESDGRIDPFLPPEGLLRQLDVLYEDKLKEKLQRPITEFVNRTRQWFNNDEQAEIFCESLSVTNFISKLDNWEYWAPRRLFEAVRAAERQIISSSTQQITKIPKQIAKSNTSPKIELVPDEHHSPTMADYGIKEITFMSANDSSGSSNSSVYNDMIDSTVITLDKSPQAGKRKSPTDQVVEKEDSIPEKKFRQSPPEDIKQPVTLPSTPSDRILVEDDSPTLKKRKLPPSPESHHIDRSTRNVSPPAPLRFDLEKVKKDTGFLDVSNNSSMPTTPTPMMGIETLGIKNDDKKMIVQVDDIEVEDEEEEEDLSQRSTTEESSHDTVGTMPVTPESGDWVDGEDGINGFSPVKSQYSSEKGKNRITEDVITVIDTATGQSSTLTTRVEDDDTQTIPEEGWNYEEEDELLIDDEEFEEEEEEEEEEDELRSESLSESSQYSKPQRSSTVSEILEKYIKIEEKTIPYLPLAPSNPKESKLWNLGNKTNKLIKDLFYQKRENLRICKCNICERSRLREMSYLVDSVGRGGVGWIEQLGISLG